MSTKKQAALEQAPVTITEGQKTARASKAKSVKPPKSKAKIPPEKFTYALKDYRRTAEDRLVDQPHLDGERR